MGTINYNKALQCDKENRRGFLKAFIKCALIIPPAVYELTTMKAAQAFSKNDAAGKTKDQVFYDEIMKTARQDYIRYT